MAHVIEPIGRLLVANRGEIARRIFRTAREMGISTVAVYADGDREAPFVREADQAISLCGKTTAETYLDIEKVVEACRRAQADAVHPGYGFLSENEAFAQRIIDEGIKWLGPDPAVIGLMGDKLSAKRIMQEAGVPTLPALEVGEGIDAVTAAETIGYPVLVKASAGGGGRGMRVVETPAELIPAIESARREAGSSFGDDTVFLEKWLAVSRHVEIQIIGDKHGNLVHCFERECSIQRRHQKVIEEAPSPALSEAMRERMGEAALAAARKLGYSSAGTVEFLVSGEDFWFLEVNARLQVEHPVSEAIIGRDLVREQIRIAEGEPLSFLQSDLVIRGHAIEARIYAEDPENGFLPSPGPVRIWEPYLDSGARFDSGVESGVVITADFDPMIAKVISHANTRREAAAKLAAALERTRIQGLVTNRNFLVNVLRMGEFLAGDTTTDFIERLSPPLSRNFSLEELHYALITVVVEAQIRRRSKAKVLASMPSGWRNSVMPPQRVAFAFGDAELRCSYQVQRDNSLVISIDEATYRVLAHAPGIEGCVDLEIDGQRVRASAGKHDDIWYVHGDFGDLALREVPLFSSDEHEDFIGGLSAPMPGTVLSVAVEPGAGVSKGNLLLVIEAMKMEHRIVAPDDGIVSALHVAAGDQVENGQLLVTLDSMEEKNA